MPPRRKHPRSAFGQLLSEARDRTGLNQDQIAKRIPISRSRLSAWEGVKPPHPKQVPRIAAALGVPETALYQALLGAAVPNVRNGEGDSSDAPEPESSAIPPSTPATSSGDIHIEIEGRIKIVMPAEALPLHLHAFVPPQLYQQFMHDITRILGARHD